MPDNVVMAKMPQYSDISNIQAQCTRRMVQKYQIHQECYPLLRYFKGCGGKVLSKWKYCFPFKVPQYTEELDEDGICIIYRRRCKEDCLVVPYNLPILECIYEFTMCHKTWI